MNVVAIISATIAIVSLLAGAVGYLSSARKDSIIAVLTKENGAVKDYNKTLEAENGRITTERDGYKRQYEDAKELGQGSPQLKVLASEFTKLTAAINKQTKTFAKQFKTQNTRGNK